MKLRFLKITVIVCVLCVLSGCSWWSKNPVRNATSEGLYQRGCQEYQDQNYEKAINAFQRVREEYPLSKLAIMAELGIADSYFSNNNYMEAEGSYTEFMTLHPTNGNLPYVMYQIAMCHCNQMPSIDRDQTESHKAKEAFERLTARFPDSKFAFMAEKKLRDCKKSLADHEFYIGYLYFKMKHYNAALKRFEGISREYAHVGVDYKVDYFIRKTRERLEKQNGSQKN